jgi:uncharacterized membrane protein
MHLLTTTVARLLFAIPLIVFGIFHFMEAQTMSAMVPLPQSVIWVYITGVAHLLAALALIINKYGKLACGLLALMLLIFILTIHVPNVIQAEGMDQMRQPMISLLKDTMIMAGALAFAGLFERSSI